MQKDSLIALFVGLFAVAVRSAPPATPLATPVESSNLDPAVFAEWVDGVERPVAVKRGPHQVIWTRDSGPEWDGIRFGETKSPGVRHLRIGFLKAIDVGIVISRGGGRLSSLKEDAAYPGDLNNDGAWIPAARLRGGSVSDAEVGEDEFAVWVFPPKFHTRALRFTHVAEPTDRSYAGWLGGAFVSLERAVNVAPQAQVHASTQDEHADRINNENNDRMWGAWDNGEEGGTTIVSPEHPEWITLTWDRPVPVSALCALWAGFSDCDVQTFTGPPDRNPAEATEADWTTMRSFDKIENQYPRALGVNLLGLDRPLETRALRLRMTHESSESHPHLNNRTQKGKRVWLGELLVLRPLDDMPLQSALPAPMVADAADHPPIPVRFNLKGPSLVTLVIEDHTGQRVRNLVSETPFPAGDNVAWWDGLDDLGRDTEAAHHGVYDTPGRAVAPGDYRVSGLYRKPLDLRYEFSVYNAGHPAWETADNTGAWLSNHTPPSSTLFLPADQAPGGKPLVYLGSYVTEGGHGLAWVDLEGGKQGGRGWVGGNWTGAPYLARDVGEHPVKDTYAYVAAAWDADLRLTMLTAQGDKPVIKYAFPGGKEAAAVTGLAVRNGRLVCSLPKEKRLMFVDVEKGALLGSAPMEDPRGLAFDQKGRLLVLSGKRLLRIPAEPAGPKLGTLPTDVVIADGLEDPQLLALDRDGNLYVSDRGNSHQVKIFSPDGKFLRAIGHAGVPKAGAYDPLHMNNPAGVTIDSNDHLWVAETDFQPKRISVWTLDGKLVNAFYGPSEYGGGGALDPTDKSRFYFHGMEFKLDWQNGTSQVVSVFHRPGSSDETLPDGFGVNGMPETPLYLNGQRYFTNCYNSNPTNGASIALLWVERNGASVPVAAMGRAGDWPILKGNAFKPRWPAQKDPNEDPTKKSAFFIWSDLNGDEHLQPDELQMTAAEVGGITVMPDLSFIASRLGDRAVRFTSQRFTDNHAPIYALDTAEPLVSGVQTPPSSGGDQAILSPDGWTDLTIAPKPFAPQSIGGAFKGVARWSYPSVWPGLHASHEAAAPDRPGELIGTTRLLGGFVTPHGSDAGPMFALNGNMGNMYLFTADGLFVATLFQDVRQGTPWAMPLAQRNMRLNDLTLHDENFWPTISQTPDGNVYLVDGGRSSLVRVDGLDSIRRFPATTVHLADADLQAARAWRLAHEAGRQQQRGRRTLHVALRGTAPVIDGKLDDWHDTDWAVIDRRGVAANFDSRSKPYDVTAAVAISGDRLFAAYRTGEEHLLENSGEMPIAPFKTGGALDLMIGADPNANPRRTAPVAGDLRLLVTLVKGKPLALVYRPVVPDRKGPPVPFSSPWRTIQIDQVEDVTDRLQFAGKDGNFELSIPLSALALKPAVGTSIRADIGVLRGSGFQTTQRVYWNNKATGITADVPSEAELTPLLWGRWDFVPTQ